MGCGASAKKYEASDDDNDTKRKLAFLANVPLLKRLPQDTHELLASACEMVDFTKDEVVIQQGNTDTEFYVIREGNANVFMKDNDGQSKKVTSLQKGDYFGEKALLKNEPRSATVIATSAKLSLLKVSQGKFKALGLQDKLHFPGRKAISGYTPPTLAQKPTQKTKEDRALMSQAIYGNKCLSAMLTLDDDKVNDIINACWDEDVPQGTQLIRQGDRKSTRLNSQSHHDLVCRLLLEKKKKIITFLPI